MWLGLLEKPSGRQFPRSRARSRNTFRKIRIHNRSMKVERVMGIEPTWPAWKAGALPLSYTRANCDSNRGGRGMSMCVLGPLAPFSGAGVREAFRRNGEPKSLVGFQTTSTVAADPISGNVPVCRVGYDIMQPCGSDIGIYGI